MYVPGCGADLCLVFDCMEWWKSGQSVDPPPLHVPFGDVINGSLNVPKSTTNTNTDRPSTEIQVFIIMLHVCQPSI